MDDAPDPMDSLGFRAYHEAAYWSWHCAMTLGFSLRLQGQRNMPRTGPALLVANHQSYLDPPLVGLAARRPLVYLARKTLFNNRWFAALIRSMHAIPIDQDGVGKEGIRAILEQLQRGHAVLVFPEGTRTPDGKMCPLKPGVHLLIKRAQVPIVPVGLAGAFDAWPSSRLLPIPAPLFYPARPGTISVSLGQPVEASHYANMAREEALADLQNRIEAEHRRAEMLRRR